MKIAFLSHFDLNLYLFRLPIMKELVRAKNEVFAVCPKGEYFEKFKDYGIKPVSYRIERSSLNPFKEISTINNIRSVVRKIDPDILHTFTHKPNIYGNFSKARNIINTVTGLGSFFIHEDIRSKTVRRVIECLYKYSAKNSKKVIFQNPEDLNYFVSKGIIPEKKAILIKSSGVDTDFFKPTDKDKDLFEELGLSYSKPVILMIARVIKDKGVLEFIDAAEILKEEAQFVYAGEIDEGNKNAFKPDFRNVKFLGFVKDVKRLISIADVVVLPSYREGIPKTLLEAAAMAKPLIATDVAGCREVVKNGYNGFLVPPKDAKALAEKIKILIDNEKIRNMFGKNGRDYVKQEFDIRVVVERYLELYDAVQKDN